MSNKTPLQQAIEKVNKIPGLADGYVTIKRSSLLTIISEFLPTEKEAIEYAFNEGYTDHARKEDKYTDGKDYFTQTYEQ